MREPGVTGPVAWNGLRARWCLRLRQMPTVRVGKLKLPGTARLGKGTARLGTDGAASLAGPKSVGIELVPDLPNAGQRLLLGERGLHESLVSRPVPRDLT